MEDIIVKAKQNDADAISKLLEMYSPIRKNLIRRYSLRGNWEDDNQELILLFLTLLKEYDGSTNFGYFIKERSRFFMLDKIKKDIGYENAVSDEDIDFEKLSDPEIFENAFLENESSKIIEKAVSNLPSDYRKIIELYFYEGLKLREIAEIMNLSVGSIHAKKDKALRKLRRGLKDFIS